MQGQVLGLAKNLARPAVRLIRSPIPARDVQRMTEALDRQPVPALCSACGATGGFECRPVLPRRLARQWRLSRAERVAVNIQQGHTCTGCGNGLRGRSLADAIVGRLGVSGPLCDAWADALPTAVLEVNPASALTPILRGAARHVCTRYPDVDMQDLPFDDGEFHLVVHSDTLEHVADPVQGIRECLRVAGRGWVLFTTPILFGRVTRSRSRLPSSYHGGDPGRSLVHWEFGPDLVPMLLAAGATEVGLTGHGYPYTCTVFCRRYA